MLKANAGGVFSKPDRPTLELPAISLHGIDLAKEVLENMQTSDKPTLVYVDPDVDGFFAAKFIIMALQEKGIPFSWYINQNREHGFLLDLDSVKGYNIINGDFEIAPDILEALVNQGCNVLSMDHHSAPQEEEVIHFRNQGVLGVTINNQYPFEDEKFHYLSGAQVTLETLRACGIKSLEGTEMDALAAITLLSDVRDIGNEYARAQLELLYTWKFKGEIRRLIQGVMGSKKDYKYGLPRMDRGFVDYSFSPSINALIRLNREDEAFKFIVGGSYPEEEVTPQQVQKEMAAELVNKAVIIETPSLLFAKIDAKDLDYGLYPYLNNMLGLVCSRLTDRGKNVLGFVVDLDGEIIRCSFRGIHETLPYRSTVADVIDARGHEIAFGVKDFKPTPELLKLLANRIGELEGTFQEKVPVKEVKNLKLFMDRMGGKQLAWDNGFKLSVNQVYLRYTGPSIEYARGNEKYAMWLVDGLPVLQFDMSLDIKKDLILPTWSRKELDLVLCRKSL